METTISKLVAFASDPDVKAIVMCQAVPGATAGFERIRGELGRDDILLIAGTPQEDPAVISAAADIVLYADEIDQPRSAIMAQSRRVGHRLAHPATPSRATWRWS